VFVTLHIVPRQQVIERCLGKCCFRLVHGVKSAGLAAAGGKRVKALGVGQRPGP
jgi:hypothetical protein